MSAMGAIAFVSVSGLLATMMVLRRKIGASETSEEARVDHEEKERLQSREILLQKGTRIRSMLPFHILAKPFDGKERVNKEREEDGETRFLIHFVRHGEGAHNVAQREWRARPGGWDGISEPYTLDTDPDMKYRDAELTTVGIAQAEALRPATRGLNPEILFVSPMRRATQTGLRAFADHIKNRNMPVYASEFLHETAGKHTCDLRLDRKDLVGIFSPPVRYDLIETESDPYWGDGRTRETWESVAERAGKFLEFLALERRHLGEIAVAAHSGFLAAMFVALLRQDDGWFRTGEMRSVEITLITKNDDG